MADGNWINPVWYRNIFTENFEFSTAYLKWSHRRGLIYHSRKSSSDKLLASIQNFSPLLWFVQNLLLTIPHKLIYCQHCSCAYGLWENPSSTRECIDKSNYISFLENSYYLWWSPLCTMGFGQSVFLLSNHVWSTTHAHPFWYMILSDFDTDTRYWVTLLSGMFPKIYGFIVERGWKQFWDWVAPQVRQILKKNITKLCTE